MVRLRHRFDDFFIVDDGNKDNGRMVHSAKTNGRLLAYTEGAWIVFPDAHLSFVGNHAIIHPNPTPIAKALMEKPIVGAEIDGA